MRAAAASVGKTLKGAHCPQRSSVGKTLARAPASTSCPHRPLAPLDEARPVSASTWFGDRHGGERGRRPRRRLFSSP